jgi:hypothetical protein
MDEEVELEVELTMFGKVRAGPTALDKLRALRQWVRPSYNFTRAGGCSCSEAALKLFSPSWLSRKSLCGADARGSLTPVPLSTTIGRDGSMLGEIAGGQAGKEQRRDQAGLVYLADLMSYEPKAEWTSLGCLCCECC